MENINKEQAPGAGDEALYSHGHSHSHGHGESDHSHSHEHGVAEHSHEHSHDHGEPEHSQDQEDHAHSHGHTHSHEHTKAVVNRLSRAIGHMEAIKRMVMDGRDCSEVLVQLAAVKSAINNTGKVILKDHIEHCIVDAVEHGDHEAIDELNNAIEKFMK